MPQMRALKDRLDLRLAKLQEKAHHIDETLRQPHSSDWEDNATESEDDEVLEDMGNHILDEISEIKAALKRLEIGTYGVCTHCGDPINYKRLSALPYTAHCVKCAALLET